MSQDNVEVVIVPGSFATPSPYDVLIKGLQAKGYRARVVPLLSVSDGSRHPAATMQDDAAEIRQVVQSILDHPTHPRNVVLASHSYGGVPATEAAVGLGRPARTAAGRDTAVVGLVYMAAFIPDAGQSARDFIRANPGAREDFKSPPPVPGTYYPAMPPESAPFIFNDVEDPAEAARLLATFSRHSADSYDGKVSYAAWRDIPSMQIVPSIDLVIPVAVQEAMYESARAREVAPGNIIQVRYEGAGHCFCIHGVWVERTVDDIIKLAESSL